MKKISSIALALIAALSLTACSETQYAAHLAKQVMGPSSASKDSQYKVGKPYQIAGKTYVPSEKFAHTETGVASWYGPGFDGKKTANGERFDKRELTAAHRTLQMPSMVKVTNLDNGNSVIVRVNDRGPFSKSRVIDVSERAAELLGFKNHGTARVRLDVLEEESRIVADMARRGQSTKGYEVAANNKPVTPPAMPAAREPIQTVSLEQGQAGYVAEDGRFVPSVAGAEPLPQPGIQTAGLTPSDVAMPASAGMGENPGGIFVQAGAFSQESSARALKERLAGMFGNADVYPTQVNGQSVYRVRIGPYAEMAQADHTLTQVVSSGFGDARLISAD
jgi:rare lipoprotein A